MPTLRVITRSGATSAVVLLLPEKATILAPRLTGNTANTPGSPVDDSGHAPTGPLYVGGDLVPAAVASAAALRRRNASDRSKGRTTEAGPPTGPTIRPDGHLTGLPTSSSGLVIAGTTGTRNRVAFVNCGGVRCDAGSGPCERASRPVEQGARRRTEGLERARSTRPRTTCAPPTVSAAPRHTLNISFRDEHAQWRN